MGKRAALVSTMLLTASLAWAQTTPGEPGSPPWLPSYWLIILIFAAVAAAIWYFGVHKRRGR